ncbi:hypothetical protein SAMD00023353_0401300 [Rosellinia necatrix]|uniref:MICOS complex subunit MIC12 n=1 Tax=Rosellinia necatrix TaxID=77044 RepID=A0A1S7UL47_ROSNE|nr:hypothetical protein SAMD00023353_0401300 [Rosellinia necatrix]
MGFTTGFTGGVTLTLGVAYLTLLAHQRSRQQQAAVLRQQTYLLSGVVDPLPPVFPPSRAERAAAERAHFAEAAKDRWNAEVEGAVRWAQAKDWTEVREGVETAVGRLWARAMGEAHEAAGNAEVKSDSSSSSSSSSVVAAAKSAYADAQVKSAELASKVDRKAEEKAEEAKGTVMGVLGKGIEKGKEVLGKAKSAVAVVEEKTGPATSPVEEALQQRYEKPNGLEQTVEEVLAARYAPIGQHDNAKLKA